MCKITIENNYIKMLSFYQLIFYERSLINVQFLLFHFSIF